MRNKPIKLNPAQPDLAELTDLAIRVSHKAKYAQLKVLYDGRVELVVPKRYPRSRLVDFVYKNQVWLSDTLAKYEQHKRDNPQRFCLKPDTIEFPSCNETWSVDYSLAARNKAQVIPDLFPRLHIEYQSEEQLAELLKKWLTQRAKFVLIPWFEAVSQAIGVPYNRVSIRGQKTRWGSCSSEKNIALNRSLLFLPKELVEYVFIHELCHTRHLNHSKRYWALVASFDRDYRDHEKQLNHYSAQIPLWAI